VPSPGPTPQSCSEAIPYLCNVQTAEVNAFWDGLADIMPNVKGPREGMSRLHRYRWAADRQVPVPKEAFMEPTDELVYIVDDEAKVGEALSALLRANGKRVQLFTSGEDFLDFGRKDSCACPEESHSEFPPTDGWLRSGFRRQYSGLRDRMPSRWNRIAAGRRTNAHFPVTSDVQEIPLCACLILDLKMPGLGGLEVQKLISAKTSIPVIFLTGRGDIPSTVRAMKGGAVDFLTKPVDEEALLASVERALRQDRASRQEAVEHASLVAKYDSLTPREREVLPLLARGMLNKQAAFELGITEYTVQIHRGHIMRKMEADSFATLVKLAGKLKLGTTSASNGNT
jgi:FixJ family two-component response regulator